MLNYKKIAVFLKTIRTIEVYDRKNGDVRRIRGALISYSILFFVKIDAYRHVLPIESTEKLQECL